MKVKAKVALYDGAIHRKGDIFEAKIFDANKMELIEDQKKVKTETSEEKPKKSLLSKKK